jgi:RNA exonuclease 1
VQKYLGREIQKGHGSVGHDSVEDAKACLDLLKQKCEKGPLWGTGEASCESIFKRLSRAVRPGASGVPGSDTRIGAVVDWGNPKRGPGSEAEVCIQCEDDDAVVEGVRVAVKGDADGRIVSGGGVDFVWARMRELEALRGWLKEDRMTKKEVSSGTAADPPTAENGANGQTPDDKADDVVNELNAAVARAVQRIRKIYDSLPSCTAFIVYSGGGDPREMSRLQSLQQQFKREYQTKKWDELSVQWTDTEEQALRQAVAVARAGIGLITVK